MFLLPFAIVIIIAQILVPRKLVWVPLLIATLHVGNAPVLNIAGAALSTTKLVLAVGICRAIYSRALRFRLNQPADKLIFLFSVWTIVSAFAHNPSDHNPFTVRFSMLFEIIGAYLFGRTFLTSQSDWTNFAKSLAICLLPLAALMLIEKVSGRNLYGYVGAPYAEAWVRGGRVRAAGPFGNAILAGTIGGVCLPLIISIFKRNRNIALLGVLSCTLIVMASASSGPIMTFASAIFALALWKAARWLKSLRRLTLAGLIFLHLVMTAPVWYLVARIDLAGGSTSWHRAELIDKALEHWSEWWLWGTDYTRHWMPYGIEWSEDHADITNYYIAMGVKGGVPLMFTLILLLAKSFQRLGRLMTTLPASFGAEKGLLWCFGASLFAHTMTFFAVAYFDQSYVLFYLTIGAIASYALKHQTLEAPHPALERSTFAKQIP